MAIHINEELCCADAFCLKVCPVNCFTMETGKATLTKVANLTCISCGQCVAICPKDAIYMDNINTTEHTASKDAITFNTNSFIEENANTIDVTKEQYTCLAKNRRSIRHFKKQAVPTDILLEALDVARYAPTAKNFQAVEWLIVDGRKKAEEINSIIIDFMRPNPIFKRMVKAYDQGLDPICRGASTLVFSHCLTELPTQYSEVDCTIAMTLFDLYLPTVGLGSCWAGYVVGTSKVHAPLKEYLKIPENHSIYAGLMVGYPTLKYHKIPQRKDLRVQII